MVVKLRPRNRYFTAACFAVFLGVWHTAYGADPAAMLPVGISKLSASERERQLVEGAKKEGEVMWYANWAGDELEKITRAFKQKYPFVNVLVFRGVAGKVEDKVTTEYRAGKHLVDIILAGTSKMRPFREIGIIGRYQSPQVSNLQPNLYDKDGWWVSLAMGPTVIGTNTNLVSPEQTPKAWRDLLDPKWKGKIGLDTEPDIMILGLLQAWGEERTLEFIRALARNQPQIRSGHTLLAQLVAAGELPIGAELYGYRVAELIAKKAPLRMSYPNPTIFTLSPIMMAAFPPHPYAAALLYDFLLSEEGQTIIGRDIGRTPVRTGIPARNPEFVKVQESDAFLALDPSLVGRKTAAVQRWIKETFLLRK
jgi:iron(III) transport system substrate-binding protein